MIAMSHVLLVQIMLSKRYMQVESEERVKVCIMCIQEAVVRGRNLSLWSSRVLSFRGILTLGHEDKGVSSVGSVGFPSIGALDKPTVEQECRLRAEESELSVHVTLRADLFAIEVDPDREGDTGDDSESRKEGIARTVVQRVEHLLTKERECEAHKRADDRRGGDGRRGITEGVYKVELNREEGAHHCETEYTRADHGYDPMHRCTRCPAVPAIGETM